MTPEWQPSAELAQAAIDAEPADPLAFWRGLVVGLCLSGCFWIALAGGCWAYFKATF